MDLCHLKNSELEPQFRKSEQGSSASQMIAAKVMDVIARQPGCDGQTADAVSAYVDPKMNPQGNEWNTLYLKITKTTLQAKGLLR